MCGNGLQHLDEQFTAASYQEHEGEINKHKLACVVQLLVINNPSNPVFIYDWRIPLQLVPW